MDKGAAKKYLIRAVGIFCVGFAIAYAVVFALCSSGRSRAELSQAQILLTALACALVPTGSFTGFCAIFLKIEELSRRQMIAMVVFCAALVIFATIYGIIILVPYFAKSAVCAAKTDYDKNSS